MKPNIRIAGLVGLLILFLWNGGDILGADHARVRISSIRLQHYTADDVAAEILFGRHLAARILGNYALWDNARANRYVNLVGKGLCLYAGRSDLKFAFALLDSDEVNAFAAPSGYIFVTRGAFQQMQDEGELATVLGHEISHVLRRHMVHELNIRAREGSAFGSVTELIGGASGSIRSSLENSLDQAARILFERGYQLSDEVEADRVGLTIASAAGYDASAMKRYLQRVEGFEAVRGSEAVRAHPQLAERLAALDRNMIALGLDEHVGNRNKERFYEMASSH